MKMKKQLAFFLALFLTVTILPWNIFATEPLTTEEHITEEVAEKIAGNAATMDGEFYPTLKDAIDAVPAEGVHIVSLEQDIVITTAGISTLDAGKTITLDMKEHDITVENNFKGRPIENRGTMIVTGNGTIDSSAANMTGYGAINNYGTLTVENGTYAGSVNSNGSSIMNRQGGVLTINGGNFTKATALLSNDGIATVNGGTFTTNSCSACNGGSYSYAVKCYNPKSELYFNNGTVTGVHGSLGIAAGYAEVLGGTFTTLPCEVHGAESAYYALYVAGASGDVEAHIYGGSYTSISKAAIYVGNNTPGDGGLGKDALVNIYGGKFISGTNNSVEYVDKEVGSLNITGGKYLLKNLLKADITKYLPLNSGYVQSGNGTVMVQKEPVIFMVSDNIIEEGSLRNPTVIAYDSKGQVVDAKNYEIQYLENADVVGNDKNIKYYDVCAKFINNKYRHENKSHGNLLKVGEMIVYSKGESQPTQYTATFKNGGGEGTLPESITGIKNRESVMPTTSMTKNGYSFMGWKISGSNVLYQPGETFKFSQKNIEITAQWKKTCDIKGTVKQDSNPIENASVIIMQGNKEIATVITGKDGKYSFTNVAPGYYTIVASKGEFNRSIHVKITDASSTGLIEFLTQKISAIVDVAEGTPSISIENIDHAFITEGSTAGTTNDVYTAADKTIVDAGGSFEITFTADKIEATDDSNADVKKINDFITDNNHNNVEVCLFLDLSLNKVVTDKSGKTITDADITKSANLIETIIPLPANLQGKNSYVVYRMHEGTTDIITEIENKNGEKLELLDDGTALKLSTKLFSTYAIAYSDTTLTTEIASGDKQVVEVGEEAIFTTTALYNTLEEVYVNGALVSSDNYKINNIDNKVSVTLTADYIKSLGIGNHSIKIISTMITSTASFSVKAPDEVTPPDGGDVTPPDGGDTDQGDNTPPPTGDSSNVLYYTFLITVSCMGMLTLKKIK